MTFRLEMLKILTDATLDNFAMTIILEITDVFEITVKGVTWDLQRETDAALFCPNRLTPSCWAAARQHK